MAKVPKNTLWCSRSIFRTPRFFESEMLSFVTTIAHPVTPVRGEKERSSSWHVSSDNDSKTRPYFRNIKVWENTQSGEME